MLTLKELLPLTLTITRDLCNKISLRLILLVTGIELGEAILLGDMDLLATGELELGSAQSLDHVLLVLGLGTHRHDHLTDVHTGNGALGFTESTAHSRGPLVLSRRRAYHRD